MSETVERHEFGAEVGRLLDLVVHALYSDREIFLRELVANAADAMDRRRFEALTDQASALPADAKVRIAPDKAARTLTITDAGIGMTKSELAQNLGTIARSGTRAGSGEGAGTILEAFKPGTAPPDAYVARPDAPAAVPADADRAARKSVSFQIALKMAGAVHFVASAVLANR